MTQIPEGMVAWAGGDRAPADWDGGPVLFRSGQVSGAPTGHIWKLGWDHSYGTGDVLAYTPIRDHWMYAQRDDTDRTAAIGIERAPMAGRPGGADVTQEDIDLEAWFTRRMEGQCWTGPVAGLLAAHRRAGVAAGLERAAQIAERAARTAYETGTQSTGPGASRLIVRAEAADRIAAAIRSENGNG